ncbi:MAG: homoserine dehydrogenase, partial [Candidatus Omnitrophica bacterium]|nr:homoserine dehydrogenase [Candidatus Omnitrophota bacterium]
MKNNVNVGLIGCGTIGRGVARILLGKQKLLRESTGLNFCLKSVCDLKPPRIPGVSLKGVKLTRNADDVLTDPSVHLVVELIGGTRTAAVLIQKALLSGKDVVSANKALFSEKGRDLYRSAASTGRHIGIEAAVCGGVPVLKGLREGLVANRIRKIQGILNGTCNYILTRMDKTGSEYRAALGEAQELGYAEADPTLDVNGTDTAHKIAILSRLAFKTEIDFKSVYREGIERIERDDLDVARELGYVLKLIAVTEKF